MRYKILMYIIIVNLLILNPLVQGQALTADIIQEAVDQAIVKVKPALVRIHVVTVYDDQGRKAKYESAGSGVIITSDGHVVTNHHVAGKAKRIVCTLYSKEEVEADLVGTDPLSDISVIKLRSPEKREFSFAEFGDSGDLKVGDRVFAMGSPMALSQSVTMGIVSNTEMILPDIFGSFKFTLEGEDVGSIVRWIGHDAPIYPGNSGGPLINLKGEIVGINEINLGISGAIPGNLAKKVAEELIRSGKVKRSWIGLEVQPLLKYAEKKRGVLVSGTIDGSPAEKAGFLPGDILIKIGDHDVDVRFNEELPAFNRVVMDFPIGADVKAVVLRDGKEKPLRLKTQEREYMRPEAVEIKKWGITARNISLLAAKEMKRKDQNGVLVTSVKPSGPCGEAKPSIVNNDVIVTVDGKQVKTVEEFLELTDRIVGDKEELISVLVTFERNDEQYATVAKIGIRKIEAQGQEIQKAWLGIAMQVVTRDIAEQLEIEGRNGIRVVQVFENTPAERAGLKVGDVIIAINGQPVDASEPIDIEVLPVMIRKYAIGSEVSITVLRNRKEFNLSVTLGSLPRPPREMKKYRDENFEFTVRDIAFMDRVNERWTDKQKGVVVENVSSGSWAGLANVLVGDLVLSVNNRPIKDVESFEDIMREVGKKKPESVVLKILRGIHTFFIELEPDWE